jgi:hypothetical protein
VAEGFTCNVDWWLRYVCRDLPEYQDTGYCVLHFPEPEEKREAFKAALEEKLNDGDFAFAGAVFPSGGARDHSRVFGQVPPLREGVRL